MKKYLHLLERLGLGEHERKIYIALLEHPYLTVTDIAEKIGHHRPIVYKGLRSLESDGLIEKSYLDGKRYYYHVTSPTRLRDKLDTLTTIADRLLPDMELLYEKQTNAPILSVKEGVDGIRAIHRDLIETVPDGGIYYRYSSSRTEYGDKSLFTPPEYEETQARKHLERIVITNEKQAKKRMNNPNREVLIVPPSFDEFTDNSTKIIYENKVAIIDYDSQTGWTIESAGFARYEAKLFLLLRDLLKKNNSKKEL